MTTTDFQEHLTVVVNNGPSPEESVVQFWNAFRQHFVVFGAVPDLTGVIAATRSLLDPRSVEVILYPWAELHADFLKWEAAKTSA